MRCLTLAEGLKNQGHRCLFICRDHDGHLAGLICNKGFDVQILITDENLEYDAETLMWNTHAQWLGVSWEFDAQQTFEALGKLLVDWLIVDHYALDARWEQALQGRVSKIMVIDDLLDRSHQCDLLLDQTYGRNAEEYRTLVKPNCKLLCGAEYALLRPEFAATRAYSIGRRDDPAIRRILITLGGVDNDNFTGKILEVLRESSLPKDCEITVVMGETAPWLSNVSALAQTMPWRTQVKVGVSDMARVMAESDLAIGAAGATSWERCCLGVPTIMVVLADNQKQVALALQNAGAAYLLDTSNEFEVKLNALLDGLLKTNTDLSDMTRFASQVTNGNGLSMVLRYLESDS